MNSPDSQIPATPWLVQLPVHEPPPGLWHRILESRLAEQQRRLRRLSALAGAAIAASLVLAVLLVLGPRSPQPDLDPTQQQLVALMRQTEQLEQTLAEHAGRFAQLAAAQQHLIVTQQAQLVALDQTLAAAYGRQDSDARLTRLWQRRLDLMADLVQLYEPAVPASRKT